MMQLDWAELFSGKRHTLPKAFLPTSPWSASEKGKQCTKVMPLYATPQPKKKKNLLIPTYPISTYFRNPVECA